MKLKKFLLPLSLSAAVLSLVSCGSKKTNTPKNPDDNIVDGEDKTTNYKVTFNTNNGTAVAEQTVKSGNKLTLPTTTRVGFTFAGWYTDAALTTEFDANTAITANITLYAKWTENQQGGGQGGGTVKTYTVTFNTNSGTAINAMTVNEGNVITSIPTTTRDGYVFAGWYTDASLTTAFVSTTAITANTTLYAKWTAVQNDNIVKTNGAYTEGLYATFAETNLKSSAIMVEYKLASDTLYTRADAELVRSTDTEGVARVDVVGLPAGTYDLKITNSASKAQTITGLQVTKEDRSGYAHFKATEGVGAYDNNGKLKQNAVVVYVTEDTKNTVQATIDGKTYTGLTNIIQRPYLDENGEKIYEDGIVKEHSYDDLADTPVDIRILGKIGAATWNSITTPNYWDSSKSKGKIGTDGNIYVKGANGVYLDLKNYSQEEIIEAGLNTLNETEYSKLNGLTNKIKWDSSKTEFDSYYNMMDIKCVKNITVEGIGADAEIFQWGFTWKGCSNVEVKNLTFDDYTEDACSAEGYEDSTTIDGFKSGRIWIHQNTFNQGVNYWDVCGEQDKHDGDGSTDFKKNAFITVSYNHYYDCHKTGLVGGSDTQKTACLTFHHNFYDRCGSRLPFARQANMHMYNNYYYGSTGTNMQIYAGAYAFIEQCYFHNTSGTFALKTSDGKVAAVKSYKNVFDGAKSYSGATVVSTRGQAVANGNLYGQTFDTNSSIFYYDSEKNVSDVSLMNTAEDTKTYVPQIAGAGVLKSIDYSKNYDETNGNPEGPAELDKATYTADKPTAPGLYYTVIHNEYDSNNKVTGSNNIQNEADVVAGNVVNIDGDTILVTDTTKETTIGYYMFEETDRYTSGKINYSVTFTVGAVGSKWNPVRFLDSEGNEVIALRAANSTKYLSYSLDGSDEHTIKSAALAANKEYTLVLSIDYDAKTATISIDGATVNVEGFTPTSISGIMFFTAAAAVDRSITVKNVSVTK